MPAPAARALVDVPRNMSDEMLRAVGENGGGDGQFGGLSSIRPRPTRKAALDILLHLGSSPVPLRG
jgi:microsomal dipeptidase-like Zn-dependent dipeptidase